MFIFQTQLQNAEEHRLDHSVVDRPSQNQLLAREQRLDSQTHRKQLTQPSIKSYGHLKKRWREYHMDIGLDGEKCLARGSPCPAPGRLKNFIAWYAETSNGTLRTKPTQVSMKNRLRDLCAMIYQETGTRIPKALNEHICGYIETELVNTHSIEDVLREKDLVDSVDFFQLLQYLWCHDTYEFPHPRCRPQIAFLIQILSYTGARPGTVVVSSAYAESNDSLKYKDFELLLMHGDDGPELVLKVTLRLAKGRRNFARATVVTLHEDRKCRGRCPVTSFLGFAFADQAFDNIHPRQIGYLKPGESTHLPLKIKDSMLEVPVCRMYSEGAISPTKAMTYNVLRNQANQLGQRLGLPAVLRPYNFRRGTANAIAGKVTAEKYTKLLNHTTKTSAEYYASNEVDVDSMGLFLNAAQETERLDKMKGMNFYKQSHAPASLPHSENQKILNDPEFKRLESVESGVSNKIAQAKANKERAEPLLEKRLASAISKRKNYYRRAYDNAYKKYRSEFFQEVGPREVQRQIRAMEGSDEDTSIADSFSDRHHSSRGVAAGYFTTREHIAEAFFRSETNSKGLPDASVLEALRDLSAPEPYVLYYPNEIPVNGKCSICSVKIESLPRQERALHIHQCYKKKSLATSEMQHSACVATRCLWDNCRSSKAKKVNHSPSMSPKQYWQHFRWHLETSDLTCRWNGCSQKLSSSYELRRHLLSRHSITTRQSPFLPQFCLQHPSLGWFTCEFTWEDHCKEHLISPQASCDLDRRHGTVVAGITCPFCLGSQKLSASDRVRQFTDRGRFNVHLQNSHYCKMKEDVDVCCPHPLCRGRPSHPSLKDLKVHFYDCHGLPEKGFAVTRGVMVGGRGASKVRSESNTDQAQKEEFDLEWSEVSGLASSADNTWEETIKQTSPESEDSSILDSDDPLFYFDRDQDQREEFDFKWSEVSGLASLADDTWEETIKQISLESEDSFIFDSKDPLFDLNRYQDEKEEFDFEWSEVPGFVSSADDTWEKIMKQTSPKFKDDYIVDLEDPLFRANAIMTSSPTYPGRLANSWSLPEDFWVGTNATVDIDDKYPLFYS